MSPEPTSKDQTAIAQQLKQKYGLYDVEILHENYSCTFDFKREITGAIQSQLERMGFQVTHEEGTIYTLQYEA